MSSARRNSVVLLSRDGEQEWGTRGDIEFGGLSVTEIGRLLCQQRPQFGVLRESALDLEPRGINVTYSSRFY